MEFIKGKTVLLRHQGNANSQDTLTRRPKPEEVIFIDWGLKNDGEVNVTSAIVLVNGKFLESVSLRFLEVKKD